MGDHLRMNRGLFMAIFGFALMVQYINCSNYSQGLQDGELATATDTGEVTSYQGVKVTSGETYMNCDEDHVQLGGTCNTGDSADNFIEYRITRDKQTVYWGPNGATTDYLRTARCENGRFFAVIPKPNDSVLSNTGSKDYVEYQIHFQIYTSADRQSYTAGEIAPAFIINVQVAGGCY